MIIFGLNSKHLETRELTRETCPSCGHQGRILSVFSQYFHIFWIPVFAFRKYGAVGCPNCDYVQEHKQFSDDLGQEYEIIKGSTRHPIYLYSGFFLILAAIAWFQWQGRKEKELTELWIQEPRIGDIYIVNIDEPGYPYGAMKVFDTRFDSVYCLFSVNIYERKSHLKSDAEMTSDDNEFYDTTMFVVYHHNELPPLLEEEFILEVTRE